MILSTIANRLSSTEKPKRQNSKFKQLMLLHWMMAGLIILLYLTGIYVARPPQINFVKWLSPFLHQSVGTLFLLMLMARIFLLLRVVSSKYSRRLPNVTSDWLRTIALHTVLYFFMLILPISGFFLRNLKGVDTTFFGISVPPVLAMNGYWANLARNSHFWASYIFLAFIVLHMCVHWKMARSHLRRLFPIFQNTRLRNEVAATTTKPTDEPLAQNSSRK